MDYTRLTLYQLFDRYFMRKEEREAIELHIATLQLDEQEIFNDLKIRNGYHLGQERFNINDFSKAELFKVEGNSFILFDRKNFKSSKAYIEDIVERYESKSPLVKAKFIEIEQAKVKKAIEELNDRLTEVSSSEEIEEIVEAEGELSKVLGFLETVLESGSNAKPTQVVLALYYFYMQEGGYEEDFSLHTGGKVKAIDELAAKHKVDAKRFQLKYNIIRWDEKRIQPSQYQNIKAVIPLLSKYPLAKSIAEAELKKIEIM